MKKNETAKTTSETSGNEKNEKKSSTAKKKTSSKVPLKPKKTTVPLEDEKLQKGNEPSQEETHGPNLPDAIFGMLHDLITHSGGNVEIHSFGLPIPPQRRSSAKSSKKQAEEAEENALEKENAKKQEEQFRQIREFRSTPREIRDYLNRFVVSQEQAKRVLSVAICDHYNHIRNILEHPEKDVPMHAKHNVILMGPTGCGKTYLMRCLAQRLGVPFVKADATKYSETGYVGYDVEDMVRDLVKTANGNVALAQYGIIYIDEIDKIAGYGEGKRDISGRGVQINLLKMLEDAEVKIQSQAEMFSPMRMMMQNQGPSTIHTKNILFIVSGAFDKLSDIIRKRTGQAVIGFNKTSIASSDKTDDQLLQDVGTEDLVKYGFEPEFVGRFPARVALTALSIDELELVLTTVENGFLEQYVEAFRDYGISLTFRREAIRAIAEKAVLEKTGARGLLTVLEHLFRNAKFELPGSGIKTLEITPDFVADSDAVLQKILGR